MRGGPRGPLPLTAVDFAGATGALGLTSEGLSFGSLFLVFIASVTFFKPRSSLPTPRSWEKIALIPPPSAGALGTTPPSGGAAKPPFGGGGPPLPFPLAAPPPPEPTGLAAKYSAAGVPPAFHVRPVVISSLHQSPRSLKTCFKALIQAVCGGSFFMSTLL